ncbi:hypothetical protein T484DRAFT_1944647, partial [Baffinella frigidus]
GSNKARDKPSAGRGKPTSMALQGLMVQNKGVSAQRPPRQEMSRGRGTVEDSPSLGVKAKTQAGGVSSWGRPGAVTDSPFSGIPDEYVVPAKAVEP